MDELRPDHRRIVSLWRARMGLGSSTLAGAGIVPPRRLTRSTQSGDRLNRPIADCCGRHREIVRCFRDRMRWKLASISHFKTPRSAGRTTDTKANDTSLVGEWALDAARLNRPLDECAPPRRACRAATDPGQDGGVDLREAQTSICAHLWDRTLADPHLPARMGDVGRGARRVAGVRRRPLRGCSSGGGQRSSRFSALTRSSSTDVMRNVDVRPCSISTVCSASSRDVRANSMRRAPTSTLCTAWRTSIRIDCRSSTSPISASRKPQQTGAQTLVDALLMIGGELTHAALMAKPASIACESGVREAGEGERRRHGFNGTISDSGAARQ